MSKYLHFNGAERPKSVARQFYGTTIHIEMNVSIK